MGKIKKIFSNGRIWIYVVFFILTIFAISPRPWNNGVAIRSVERNSTAYNSQLSSPGANTNPIARERIVKINGVDIDSVLEFEKLIQTLPHNSTMTITTEKTSFWFFDKKQNYILSFKDPESLGLKVYDAPKNNIRLGLDLQGGTRVVLQPEKPVSADDMDIILRSIEQRLDLFGVSDTVVRPISDLSGNQFILVEIAGVNEDEVKELIAKQGKFEAKIGNETVFLGGTDVTYVCRTAQCSGLDPTYGCRQTEEGQFCRFRFSITLSSEAAERQSNITRNLNVVYEGNQAYLSENLDLYLDNKLVDSLRIGSELKGNAVTEISISGSGFGRTRQEALEDTNQNMKRLQTILITGSLPVKLDVIKTDELSPSLGREFLQNAMLIGILSTLVVATIVIIRYRKIKIAVPIVIVITSEILLILGIPALIPVLRQNLDIAGIAGIIVAIGTGVDDQIVITDEILQGGKKKKDYETWSSRIKKAFFIVIAAYAATMASMVPLLFAGAGLLRGFAMTTMIGVTSGVLITRPAFAEMMRIILED